VRVRFTPAARDQFLAAIAYIAGQRPAAARRLLKKTTTALRRLTRHPESGRRLPEFPDLPHREVVLPPYRFFYRLEKQTVWIVAVWHGAQLPDAPEGT
jgi:plasmid stabilization system protein ParE